MRNRTQRIYSDLILLYTEARNNKCNEFADILYKLMQEITEWMKKTGGDSIQLLE